MMIIIMSFLKKIILKVEIGSSFLTLEAVCDKTIAPQSQFSSSSGPFNHITRSSSVDGVYQVVMLKFYFFLRTLRTSMLT